MVAVAVLVPLGVLVWTLAAGGDEDAGRASGLLDVGVDAPGFTLTSLDGEEVSLADHAGEPVVLTFLASWCGPCDDEVPVLQEALDDRPGEFAVLGVLFGDQPDRARAFLAEHGATFPALDDVGLEVAGRYGVRQIPVTFFVDEDGTIVDRVFGITSRDALEEPLARLLAA